MLPRFQILRHCPWVKRPIPTCCITDIHVIESIKTAHLKDCNCWNNVRSSATTRQTAHIWMCSKSRLHSPAYIWAVVSHQIVCVSASLFVNSRCHFDDAEEDNVTKYRTKPEEWEKTQINPKVRQRGCWCGRKVSSLSGMERQLISRLNSFPIAS